MKQPSYILVVNGTKVQRPVFVLGAPHSGVPVIAGALARATGFHLGGGSTAVLNAVYSVARNPTLATEKVAGTASLLREAYAEEWQLTPLTCPQCPGSRGVRVPANVSAEPCEHSRSVTRYGDATPELLFCADALYEAFPDALFVQVIRDGRDVVARMAEDDISLAWHKPSVMKPASEFPNHFYGLSDNDDLTEFREASTVGQCAMRWRGAVRMSARVRRNVDSDQLLTLRYEDIHGGEVSVAKKLRAFTGARVSASHLVLEDGSWGVGAWRRQLDRDASAELYEKAAVELSHLGYL
ncbi:sulfotransferase [Nocardiopsis sp. HNM0947]|uniref:Sulfotransferase n=1 Tax=Nocardiopsis coralli TaxID=2772213 RepID=A0ABR9P1Q5_9ACTN|nr:sulfotransferase [Nocardiopsis coralli]MBE2997749.1 sulfotransferase [Nocardiopsis coralli]